VVATSYDVLCDHKYAEEARNHLAKLALKGEVAPRLQEFQQTSIQQTPVQQTQSQPPRD
jgi:hypothetical protein